MNGNLDYYIIDALAPFILPRCIHEGQVINWSKIPYFLLEKNGIIPDLLCKQIEHRFETYARKVASTGYTALSIDDLAHLTTLQSYSSLLKNKIEHYRVLFSTLFSIAGKYNLDVFINTDAAFAPEGVTLSSAEAIDRVKDLCRDLFVKYPGVRGVILRLGECDGVDVRGELRSNLVFHKARHVKELIAELVGLFAYYQRTLIVRTWSVGAYEIGDLMWNPSTYRKIFGQIDSENLIISHKYGDTDFFRYLALNPLVFYGDHRKIVEFQTRREYEGFGEFPSFVGYEYEKYREKLAISKKIAGIHVWCQTGGWSRFHKPTYMPGSSVWNEVNTEVTVNLFKEKMTVHDAVRKIALEKFPGKNPDHLETFLKTSDEVIRKLWYLPEFSQQVLYFRGLRIPPVVWIFWDTILVNATLRRFIRRFVKHRKSAIDEGYDTLKKIDIMHKMAVNLGCSQYDYNFHYATFELLAKIREYFLGEWSDDLVNNLVASVQNYSEKYPYGFSVNTQLTKAFVGKRVMNLALLCIVRTHPEYRLMEKKLFGISLLFVRPLIKIWGKKRFPRIANERAMGIDTLLK